VGKWLGKRHSNNDSRIAYRAAVGLGTLVSGQKFRDWGGICVFWHVSWDVGLEIFVKNIGKYVF